MLLSSPKPLAEKPKGSHPCKPPAANRRAWHRPEVGGSMQAHRAPSVLHHLPCGSSFTFSGWRTMDGETPGTPTPWLSLLCAWGAKGGAASFGSFFAVMRKGDRRNNHVSPGHAVLWGGAGSERLPSGGEGGEGVAEWLALSPGHLSHCRPQPPSLPPQLITQEKAAPPSS